MELRNRTLGKKRELYTTILGQSFSPCNKFLACCGQFEKITIFHVAPTLNAEVTLDSIQPYYSFHVPDKDQVLCLTSYGDYLAGGSSNGRVYMWRWSVLIGKKSEDVIMLRIISSNSINIGSFEINSVVFSDDGLRLYGAGGDGAIHVWSIPGCEYLQKLEGHSDSILCLNVKSEKIVSGSEDGFVKVWDARAGSSPLYEICPSNDNRCHRSDIGNWIKCLTLIPGRNWIVCGGGPRLSLWHEDYKTSLCTFDVPSIMFNDVIYHDGTIISGGNESFVRHWSINGKEEACVPCTPSNVFSIKVSNENALPKVLSVAGNCNKVDICTNFSYKAFSFHVI